MGTSFPTVLEQTGDGDPSAFATLWHEYQPSLLRDLRVTDRRCRRGRAVSHLDTEAALQCIAGLPPGQRTR